MSSESSVRRAAPASENIRTIVLRKNSCGFGRCVIALADGIKPAQWLANSISRYGGKCTERHAQYLIDGKRKPNARAVLAVNAAMLD